VTFCAHNSRSASQRLQASLDADHLTSFFSELQPAEQHGAWRVAKGKEEKQDDT
jgi:hypothetical protein